ncbi:MAG: hypothetical protein VX822_01495 [Candidatus Neomarinimicrobiota bacterium]|nr:hypothetical protein [Candidatus Neomarinimicrobiota bacterium]
MTPPDYNRGLIIALYVREYVLCHRDARDGRTVIPQADAKTVLA